MIAMHQQRYPSSTIYNITDLVRVIGAVEKAKVVQGYHAFLVSHPATTLIVNRDAQTATLAGSKQVAKMAEKGVIIHDPIKEEDIAAVTTSNTKTPFNIFEDHTLFR